jgi:uncharacterized protein YfiM (DUF2279 family)
MLIYIGIQKKIGGYFSKVLSKSAFFLFTFIIVAYGQIPVDTTAIGQDTTIAKINITPRSPAGALIRSAILPGWGQYYNKSPLKSALFIGTESSFLYLFIREDKKFRDEDKKLKNSTDNFERQIHFDNRELYRDSRSLWMWWFLGIYLLNLGDAYVDAHLSGFDVSPELSIKFNMNNEPTFTASLNFYRLPRFNSFQFFTYTENNVKQITKALNVIPNPWTEPCAETSSASISGSFRNLTQENNSSPKDEWIAPDKAKHLIASMIATVFSYNLSKSNFNLSEDNSKFIGVSFSLSLGIAKEIRDSFKENNFFSYKDLIADLAGIGIGMILISIK